MSLNSLYDMLNIIRFFPQQKNSGDGLELILRKGNDISSQWTER